MSQRGLSRSKEALFRDKGNGLMVKPCLFSDIRRHFRSNADRHVSKVGPHVSNACRKGVQAARVQHKRSHFPPKGYGARSKATVESNRKGPVRNRMVLFLSKVAPDLHLEGLFLLSECRNRDRHGKTVCSSELNRSQSGKKIGSPETHRDQRKTDVCSSEKNRDQKSVFQCINCPYGE
jgi:hypothetical protein